MNAGVVGFGNRMKHFWTVFLSRMSGWAAAKDWWRAFFAMLLLSRARVGPGLAPFAAAYFAVSMESGPNLAALLAGCLAGAAGSLYYLSGNTEFFWSTYQQLPAAGFNGIPVALLAVNNPIAVVFTGMFMSMLDIAGLQLTNLTAYNEYITDVIIAVIVYLSAFSLVIKMLLSGRRKKKEGEK